MVPEATESDVEGQDHTLRGTGAVPEPGFDDTYRTSVSRGQRLQRFTCSKIDEDADAMSGLLPSGPLIRLVS